MPLRIVGEDFGDRRDVLDAAERADLERVDRHVLEQATGLVGDPFRVDWLDGFHAKRVLHRDRGDDRQRVATHARQSQQVGLYAGASGRIGRGERQHQRWEFRIFVGRRGHCRIGAKIASGDAAHRKLRTTPRWTS